MAKQKIKRSELKEMVKSQLLEFVEKQKLQEEKNTLESELKKLNEVEAGAEMNKEQPYHSGQRKPVFNVKGTHLTEEGEDEIDSPKDVKGEEDLDQYIQNLLKKAKEREKISQNESAEGEIEEGIENAVEWEGDIAKLYDYPIAKYEDGEIVFTDEDAEKAVGKHKDMLKSKYEKSQKMVSEEEGDEELSDEVIPDWLKTEIEDEGEDGVEEDVYEEEVEEFEEAEDMGEFVSEEDESEYDMEEEVDLDGVESEMKEKMDPEEVSEVMDTVKGEMNESKNKSSKELINESERSRLQMLAGL